MSEAEKPSRGLLSKVVRFVTKPTTQWSELDKTPDAENTEEQLSKQALKEIMERKRRNDFVRKLEFDQLRKIRREANKSSGTAEGLGARSSSAILEAAMADDSLSSRSAKPVHPANTIEKINEIEQQMSKQWWAGDGQPPAPPAVTDGETTGPVPPGPSSAPVPPEAVISAPTPLQAQAPAPASAAVAALAPAAFDEQVESGRFIHDVDLEEAAVLYANGDPAGAEASLLALVQQRSGDLMGQLTVWLTLFDLYRATGDQTKFDFHAIEFASKYGRSAPVWFSMPEQLGAKAQAEEAGGGARSLNWQAPPALSAAALAGLQGNLKRFAPPWTLNWSRVTEVRDEVVTPLLTLFRYWAEQPEVRVTFVGTDKLLALLESETPVGDKSIAEDRWSLRMALLRLMGLELDFEAAALDYCVTYEVSPPSWTAPKLEFSSDSQRSPAKPVLDSLLMPSELPDMKKPSTVDGPHGVLEGVVEGDAAALLDQYTPLVEPGRPFTVRCDRLMRIDFVAAGSVLNWVAECQQKNALVRFSNLHRLNAVFFNLIGINEHSIVNQREN